MVSFKIGKNNDLD